MRLLGGKYRIDGDQIINPSGVPIPVDEPVFLFRARDNIALDALQFYLAESKRQGCTDHHINGVEQEITKFVAFAVSHPERMKQPGVTRGK